MTTNRNYEKFRGGIKRILAENTRIVDKRCTLYVVSGHTLHIKYTGFQCKAPKLDKITVMPYVHLPICTSL